MARGHFRLGHSGRDGSKEVADGTNTGTDRAHTAEATDAAVVELLDWDTLVSRIAASVSATAAPRRTTPALAGTPPPQRQRPPRQTHVRSTATAPSAGTSQSAHTSAPAPSLVVPTRALDLSGLG